MGGMIYNEHEQPHAGGGRGCCCSAVTFEHQQ